MIFSEPQYVHPGRSRSASPDLPYLFLLPGMGGYDPDLVEIGVACKNAVRPVKISYPPWRTQLRDPGFDLSALVNDVVKQITAHCSTAPILLAGYSFGGIVAFAVATRLRDAGYPVQFLGLLDTEVQPGVDFVTGVPYPPMTRRRELKGFIAALRRGDAKGKLAFVLARELSKRRWKPALRLFARTPRRWLHGEFLVLLDRDLLSWHIQPMLWQWAALRKTLPPLPVPAVLFRTDHHDPSALRHLGWKYYCPRLTVVSVPGTHNGMLGPSNLPTLCAIFRNTVLQALASGLHRGTVS